MQRLFTKPIHVSVGNLNIDITMYVPRLPKTDESIIAEETIIGPGGSASNYSVAATFYGHKVFLIATTSDDPLVDQILEKLAKIGVDTTYVKRVEGVPGIVSVIVIPGGERIIVKYRGVNELLSPNDIPKQVLQDASIVHITSIPPSVAGEIARRANGLGVLVSYDPGAYAYLEKDKVLDVIKYVNIIFLNRREAKALAGNNPKLLLKMGPSMVVVKKGPGGAYVLLHGDMIYYGVSKPIRPPVDSTGAGDAFDAFFNAVYLDYKDPGKALQYALAAGAMKVMCRGSQICWDKNLFNKQLNETTIEAVKNPKNWVLED